MYKVNLHKRLAMGEPIAKGKRRKGKSVNDNDADDMPKKGKRRKGGTEKVKLGGKTSTIKKGGLHRSTGTPMGKKIPKSKLRGALAGKYGAKAKKEANMAVNVFHVSKKR